MHLGKDYLIRIQQNDISAWSAKLAFFLLLSIFPFIIFLMEILNHISIDNVNITTLTQFFPPEIVSILSYIVEDITSVKTSSSVLPIAIIASVWSASKGIMAIIGGLNMAYKEKETRSYFYLRALSLIYTVAFAFIILMTLGFIVFGNKIIGLLMTNIPILSEWIYTIDVIRIISSIILSFLFFMMLYNATPNRKIMIKDVMPGAIFSTICWNITSFLFSLYVNKSNSFSYMYGSLTGIIILLLWLYISSTIIMLGGVFNAIISEHKH